MNVASRHWACAEAALLKHCPRSTSLHGACTPRTDALPHRPRVGGWPRVSIPLASRLASHCQSATAPMLRLNRSLYSLGANTPTLVSCAQLLHVRQLKTRPRLPAADAPSALAHYVVAALGATVGLLSASIVFADRPASTASTSATSITIPAPSACRDRPSRDTYKYLICGGGVAAREALSVFVEQQETADLLVVSPEWRTTASSPPVHGQNGPSSLSSDATGEGNYPPNSLDAASTDNSLSSPEASSLGRLFRVMSSSLSLRSTAPDGKHGYENAIFDTGDAEIVLGRRVTAIDTQERVATLDDGTNITFDKVLIAVGNATPRIPLGRVVTHSAARFVGTAQSVADWAAIARIFKQHATSGFGTNGIAEDVFSSSPPPPPPPHFTVVGGDWMAAIVGARLVRMGASVTFAYAEPCFLARCLPKYVAQDVRARLQWLAEEVDGNEQWEEHQNGIDLLAYSAIRFITARPSLAVQRNRQLTTAKTSDSTAGEGELEAEVHAGSVFDAFSIVDFRTDCVLFAPTGGNIEPVDVSGVTKSPSHFENNKSAFGVGHHYETNVSASSNHNRDGQNDTIDPIATNAQLSAAADIYVAGAATGQWGVAHAVKTGRHAAENMLGARRALEITPPRTFIDLSDVGVGVTLVGQVDGSAESFGYFATDRDRRGSVSGSIVSSPLADIKAVLRDGDEKDVTVDVQSQTQPDHHSKGCYGGRFVRGVVFCVAGAPPRFRGDGLRLSIKGVALWNGVPPSDARALQQVDDAAQHAEQLTQLPPMTRADMERVMDAYVRRFVGITDFEDVVVVSQDPTESSDSGVDNDQSRDNHKASNGKDGDANNDNETERHSDDVNADANITIKADKTVRSAQESEQHASAPTNIHAYARPLTSRRPVPGVVWKRHVPARRVALRSDELLWVDNDWVGAASPINTNDAKAQAYADLLRRSAGG